MTIQIDAVFENGVLKPTLPLNLSEGAKVRVTVRSLSEDADPLGGVIGICDGPPDGAAKHDQYVYGKPRS